MEKRVAFAAAVLLLLTTMISCSGGNELSFSLNKNRNAISLSRGRIKRSALVDFPSSIKYGSPLEGNSFSLVIALHGAGTSAEDFRNITAFGSYCDDMNAILLYPQGILERWDNINDNTFINDLISVFSEKYRISNVYLTGFSAGAVKVLELAETLEGKVDAIAPVSGLLKHREDPSKLPAINLLHIHSLDDREVPSEGIYEEGFYSVKDELDFFRKAAEKNQQKIDVEEIVYETQGHVWNEKNTEAIMDFFYNHPEKPCCLNLALESESFIFSTNSKITAHYKIQNPENADEIKVFANGKEIFSAALSADEKFLENNFYFSIPTEGLVTLKGELKLKSCEKIVSTKNPRFLSVRSNGENNASFNPIKIIGAKSSGCETKDLNERNCFDGKLSTRWSSAWSDNEEIVFELSELQEVSRMILFWERASALEYDVLCSLDEKEWKKIYENKNCPGGTELINHEPSKARFIKLDFKKRRTNYGYSLWEVFFLSEWSGK